MTASTWLIPFNPQVPILPFPHHSMLLLSNQPSEAKAVTSNPHPLFPFSLTNRLDDYKPLNTQSINRQLPHRFKQTRFHSIHFQWDHRLGEECEEWSSGTGISTEEQHRFCPLHSSYHYTNSTPILPRPQLMLGTRDSYSLAQIPVCTTLWYEPVHTIPRFSAHLFVPSSGTN